jgi:7-keto-8-aminopelargonate synthetase-like enzyme
VLLNQLAAATKEVRDKDADLQLAAEIGQMLLEKNARTEEVAAELQTQVDRLTKVRNATIGGGRARTRHHLTLAMASNRTCAAWRSSAKCTSTTARS